MCEVGVISMGRKKKKPQIRRNKQTGKDGGQENGERYDKRNRECEEQKKKRGTPPLLVVEESQQRAPTLRETLSVLL